MNSASAIFLGLCIAGFLALDAVLYDWALSLALAQRFVGLLNWMAFWR